MTYILLYIAGISVIAVALTVLDKYRAKRHKWRIPENTLMLVGLLGGAVAMYITMRFIHHKTLHKKFMVGLPIEIILHFILVLSFLFLYT